MQHVAHIRDWAYHNWLASETIEQAMEWEIVLDDYRNLLDNYRLSET